jgi:hypothetical protein
MSRIKFYQGPQPPTSLVEAWSERYQSLVDRLKPACPEGSETWGPDYCSQSCEFHQDCEICWELREFFRTPTIVCMCGGDGHHSTCMLGEAGKKLRRRIEDRLRKDPELTQLVGRIIGL